MTQDELRNVWLISKARKSVRHFAFRLINQDPEWDKITYICSLSMSKDNRVGTTELLQLMDVPSMHGKPFSHPFFRVTDDTELMLARMIITDMRAWDFRTAKKVIRANG